MDLDTSFLDAYHNFGLIKQASIYVYLRVTKLKLKKKKKQFTLSKILPPYT